MYTHTHIYRHMQTHTYHTRNNGTNTTIMTYSVSYSHFMIFFRIAIDGDQCDSSEQRSWFQKLTAIPADWSFFGKHFAQTPLRESWEHCGVDLNLILSLQMGIMCKMTLDSLLTFLSLKLATGQSHSPPDLEAEVIPSAHTYLEHWTSSFHWELMKAIPGLSGYPELSKQRDSSPLSLPVLWVHDTSELLSLGLWLD